MFGFFSKAPAQPTAQNVRAANPAAPETMDVDGVHADASLPASPSLHAVSMPAIHTLHGLQARVEEAILQTLPLCAACKPWLCQVLFSTLQEG